MVVMDTRLRRKALGLAVGGALLLLASCTTSTAGANTGSAAATAQPSSSSTQALDTFHGGVIGRGDYPTYTVQAPDGWSSYRHAFTVKDQGLDVMGVSVWDVGKVPLDPCNWKGTYRNAAGASVNDLVKLLSTEKGRTPTDPSDTSLDGYSGRYFELTTPADMKVTGDSDFTGCDTVDNGHLDYIGWLGNGTGERYSIVAGQVDHIWVLDVNGQTLLVDAINSPDATPAQLDEMMGVVQSIQFS
jgi:hypothetical protein